MTGSIAGDRRRLQQEAFLDRIMIELRDREEYTHSQKGRIKMRLAWCIAIQNHLAEVEHLPPLITKPYPPEYQEGVDFITDQLIPDLEDWASGEGQVLYMLGKILEQKAASLALSMSILHGDPSGRGR